MKQLLTILLLIGLISSTFSQVEMGKTKSTLSGKNGILLEDMKEAILDQFSITLNLYSFAEDQGGGNARVGVRADLSNIDKDLSKEIVNEAYAYFKEQWQQRGVTVKSATKEEIESSKKYKKNAGKGNASIISGDVNEVQDKKTHTIQAWPDNVNFPVLGSGLMATYTNSSANPPDYKGDFFFTSFGTTVNFIEFKTAKLGSTASVRGFPKLVADHGMGLTKWKGTKFVLATMGNRSEGIEDFYEDMKEDNTTVLGSSFNSWNYIGDKEKYKANVLEMIKMGMNDIFAEYDAVIEKEKN